MKKLWAWIRHPGNNRVFHDDNYDHTICSSTEYTEGWFYEAPVSDEKDNYPDYSMPMGVYVRLSRTEDGRAWVTIHLSESGVENYVSHSSLVVYDGPAATTEENLLEFWAKLVSEKLTKE